MHNPEITMQLSEMHRGDLLRTSPRTPARGPRTRPRWSRRRHRPAT